MSKYSRLVAHTKTKAKKRLNTPKGKPLVARDVQLITDAAREALEMNNTKGQFMKHSLPRGVRCLAWFYDGRRIRQCLRKTVVKGYCSEHMASVAK